MWRPSSKHSPRRRVVARRALEALVVAVDALMSHKVAALDEGALTGAADVRAVGSVATHVVGQVRLLWSRVGAVFE